MHTFAMLSSHITSDAESSEWKVEARNDRKVEAIKAFRRMADCGLKEAKDVVVEYIDRYNRGEVFHGTKVAATVNHVSLPNGGQLKVVTEGEFTSITYVNVENTNLRSWHVHQAVADAVVKYSA